MRLWPSVSTLSVYRRLRLLASFQLGPVAERLPLPAPRQLTHRNLRNLHGHSPQNSLPLPRNPFSTVSSL